MIKKHHAQHEESIFPTSAPRGQEAEVTVR